MPESFILLIPMKTGVAPQAHPSLLNLLEHARDRGAPLWVENVVKIHNEGGLELVQLTLTASEPKPTAPKA